MRRNLDRRIEAVTPIEDNKLKQELYNLLITYLEDNCCAWNMDKDGNYQKKRPDEFKKYSQFELVKKSS